MPDIDKVEAWLKTKDVTVLRFAEATPTSATAAAAIGCTPAEIAKSILFIVGGAPALVVTSGDMKVRSGQLKQALGRSGKVRLPAGDEVRDLTGYLPGGVCPFLLPQELTVVVDRSLQRFATVYPAAGDDHSGVPVTPEQLRELCGGQWVEVCQPLFEEAAIDG